MDLTSFWESVTSFWQTYWMITLVVGIIALSYLWKYLKKNYPHLFKKKEKKTVIIKKIKDLNIPEQIDLLKQEQEAIEKELRKLDVKKQRLLKIARINTVQYESLREIKRIR